MDNYNRTIILITVFLRKFISVFFTLFFNIYVLKIVNDVGIIIKYKFKYKKLLFYHVFDVKYSTIIRFPTCL